MKKTICLVFSLTLLLFALNFTAFAANRESEDNNDFTKADPISVNETWTGNIADGDDADGRVTCTCGKVNNPGSTFCFNCGKRLK